ncbi:hypothetical protein JW905_19705 [bacterium]|nr:hypothetical protein [candidate division CSSED10-310 bacterium]
MRSVGLSILLAGLLVFPAAAVTKVTGYPAGEQVEEELNRGLPHTEHGYHPVKSASWGESWYMLAVDSAGNQVWVLFSINNYHPFRKNAGTVDLFYYPMDGSPVKGHAEYDREKISAALDSVRIDLAGNVIAGAHPTYHITAESEDLRLDLEYSAKCPDFLLGGNRLNFDSGDDHYWTVGVMAPLADVHGTVTVRGEPIAFHGLGYFDHAYATIKIPAFSRWWYVFRVLQEDLAIGIMKIDMRKDYSPGHAAVVHIVTGDRIVVNSGAIMVEPSGAIIENASGVTYPDTYRVDYDDGTTSLTGTFKLQRLVEAFNVLDHLSAVVRTVIRALYPEMWQLRFLGEADLTLSQGGAVRTVHGRCIGEVHCYL